MTVRQTVYRSAESGRKQLKMQYTAYEVLRDDSEGEITKGVHAYEAILFCEDGIRDELDKVEDQVDARLDRLSNQKLNNSLEKIKISSVKQESGEMADSVNIYLPEDVIDELPFNRGVGVWIGERVLELYNSAYEDRMDRIQVKQQIADYIESDVDPVHPVAKSIVEGDDEYRLAGSHDDVMQAVGDTEWWERDDLSFEELRQRADEVPKSREQRLTAYQTGISNSNMDDTGLNAIIWLSNLYEPSAPTLRSYMDELGYDSTCDYRKQENMRVELSEREFNTTEFCGGHQITRGAEVIRPSA